MSDRVFEGRLADELAPEDRARRERLKAVARTLASAVRDGLERDGFVRIHGFGTFRLRPVAARSGRHPRTGQRIRIPAGWRVMFRPAKALRERVDPGPAAGFALAEPRPSREAMLGAGAAPGPATHASGGRAAAAAMPERVETARGPVPPASDSRARAAAVSPAGERVHAAGAPANADDAGAGEGAPAPRSPDGGADAADPERPAPARPDRRPWLIAALVLLALLLWWAWPSTAPRAPVATAPDAGGDAASADNPADTAGPSTGKTAETAGETAANNPSEPQNAAVGSAQASTGGSFPEAGAAGADTAGADAAGADGAGADGAATTPALPSVGEAGAAAAPAGAAEAPMPAVAGGDRASGIGADAPAGPADVGGGVADRATGAAEGGGGPWFGGADYRVRAGDTLWGLARSHYVNPYYWPHIWNRNTGLADPNRIEVDEALRLPPLQGPPRQLAAADRESIAEGYLRLYRFRRARNADNAGFALVGARFFDAAVLPSDLRARGSTGNPATRVAAFRDRFHSAFPATRAD